MNSKEYAKEIIALRNEKGSYNLVSVLVVEICIIALRNEKGSYNSAATSPLTQPIIALRNEKRCYYNTV